MPPKNLHKDELEMLMDGAEYYYDSFSEEFNDTTCYDIMNAVTSTTTTFKFNPSSSNATVSDFEHERRAIYYEGYSKGYSDAKFNSAILTRELKDPKEIIEIRDAITEMYSNDEIPETVMYKLNSVIAKALLKFEENDGMIDGMKEDG